MRIDILFKLNPGHAKFMVVDNGVRVLYVRLIKAMCSCVKSALHRYNMFSSTLKDMGFEMNPYNPVCIANCTIKGKQCTIAWYVDDNEVVSMIIEKSRSALER